MRRLPPLNALRAFEATARLSSITAAAQELGVTHSAVSQQVRRLEDYMGRKLFDRPGKQVAPTKAGRELLRDVAAAFDQIASASERLTHRGTSRVLTVGAPACFALRWLVPRMAQFQRLHPGLELRVDTVRPASAAWPDRTHDVVICREELDWPGYSCRRFLDDRRVVVVAPHLARHHTLARPADLDQATLLHVRSDPNDWRLWFEQHAQRPPQRSNGPVFDDISLALEAARSGLGAFIAPFAFVERDLLEGRLVAPFLDLSLPGGAFYILHQESNALERGLRELLRWLHEEGAPSAETERVPAIIADNDEGPSHSLSRGARFGPQPPGQLS